MKVPPKYTKIKKLDEVSKKTSKFYTRPHSLNCGVWGFISCVSIKFEGKGKTLRVNKNRRLQKNLTAFDFIVSEGKYQTKYWLIPSCRFTQACM